MNDNQSRRPSHFSPLLAGLVGAAAAVAALLVADEKYRKKAKKIYQDLKKSGEDLQEKAAEKAEKLEEIGESLSGADTDKEDSPRKKK